ncbi:hypothetical protein BDR06DRAFT_894993, partial [Suillus hirtellus]
QILWLHGTVGVGKCAIAFTMAEKRKTRLAGTFLFSHKHIKRYTTGHFFAMLTYHPANNFPTVRGLRHVDKAVLEDPALLEPDKSVRDQTEGPFF